MEQLQVQEFEVDEEQFKRLEKLLPSLVGSGRARRKRSVGSTAQFPLLVAATARRAENWADAATNVDLSGHCRDLWPL